MSLDGLQTYAVIICERDLSDGNWTKPDDGSLGIFIRPRRVGYMQELRYEKLYGVVRDVITLPEFIQSQFSQGDIVEGKRFGGLRAVRNLKKAFKRPGTDYLTKHQMDLAASLPLAAAFRELLEMRNDRYVWKVRPEEVFEKCAEELYKVLASKSRTAKSVNSLGSDTELWTQAVNIVLRTKDDLLAAAPRTS